MAHAQFIDVHTFDGHCKHYAVSVAADQAKQDCFALWLSRWPEGAGKEGIKLIVRDTGQAFNLDSSNGVYADDILFEILRRVSSYEKCDLQATTDTLAIINEQMADMLTLGQCPSGRSIRLLQILNYCRDYDVVPTPIPTPAVAAIMAAADEVKGACPPPPLPPSSSLLPMVSGCGLGPEEISHIFPTTCPLSPTPPATALATEGQQ